MRKQVASSLVLLVLAGCPERADEAPAAAPAAPVSPSGSAALPSPDIATPTSATSAIASADAESVAIAAGAVRAGSLPGSAGRDPGLEADDVAIELGAFRIDRLPYPNREGLPPRAGVSRPEASALCAAEGKRLCTELEWERACEHDGAIALASGVAEWTASTAGRRFGTSAGRAVVRGVSAAAATPARRCDARDARPPEGRASDLGFRCCEGDPNEAPYPTEPARPAFREIEVPVETLRAALATIPALARSAAAFELFTQDEVSAVFTRAGVDPVLADGMRRANGVLEWAPSEGELAWVITGRSGEDSLVAVIHPLPDGRYTHAASMILDGDPLSVLVTYLPGNARSLAWTTCFGCAGEGGEIQYRADDRIVVVQL